MNFKILALVLLIGLVLVSGCSSPPAQTNPNTDTGSVAPPSEKINTGISGQTVSDSVKEFTIIAKNWDFEPSTITVKKGDKVKIMVKSIDVPHGLALLAFNVNVYLDPGKEQTVEFTADKVGTFTFFCNVFCGSGHSAMRGKLIVTE